MNEKELKSFSFYQRFLYLGASDLQLRKWAEEAITVFELEPDDADIIADAIKNYSVEKKA